MERVTDRNFCATREIIFSSTGVDRHGDRLPLSELRQLKSQIENHPEKRYITLRHNSDDVAGEMIDVWIKEDEEEDLHYLCAEIGIYEGNEEVVGLIESGELGGFSIAGHLYENCDAEYWESRTPNVRITADGHDRKSLNPILRESGEEYRIEVQKSLGAEAIFEFATENWDTIENILTVVALWYINRTGEGIEISPTISIVSSEVTIDVDSLIKRVEKKVEAEDIEDGDAEKVRDAVRESLEEAKESE